MSYYFRKWLRFPRILFIVAVIGLLAGVLIPGRNFESPPVINTSESLMTKILELVSKEIPKKQILNSLTQQEKEMLVENRIDWVESVPVRTLKGVIKPEYLPFEHVVVYGFPELRAGKKRWRGGFFLNAMGQKDYVGKVKSDVNHTDGTEELQKLIWSTRVGTFDVLLSNMNSIDDLSDIDKFNVDVLHKYIILKKLINKSPDYAEYAITAMTEKGNYLDIPVDNLLRKSIISPRPPDIQPFYTEAFRMSWKNWYAENLTKVQITNDFLFENDKGKSEN